MRKSRFLMPLVVIFIMLSCSDTKRVNSNKTDSIPIKGLETTFVEVSISPQKDSIYVLANGTKIEIKENSLLDSLKNPITESVIIKFRQFDDAVSIFLSGLPMGYSQVADDMYLQTAGMFEIRGKYKGSDIIISKSKPISVTIGSNFEDTRQGFFKLNDKTQEWTLVDIPEVKYNEEVLALRKKASNLKPRWELPLTNYYVFSLGRMADIFLGDEWSKIRDANMNALTKKMKSYGVTNLDIERGWYNNTVIYKGNKYDHGEMLWKSNSKINPPKWVHKVRGGYWDGDYTSGKRVNQITTKKIKGYLYELKIIDAKKNRSWSTKLELVTHLRYLTRYSPQQLIAKQEAIEKEIEETEVKLKKLKLIEYTGKIYSMGIYNCDKPGIFREGRPTLFLSIDNKSIDSENIHNVSTFNYNLSSYRSPVYSKLNSFAFFNGTNKFMMVTKDGEIGLLTGIEFDKIDSLSIVNSDTIEINLVSIEPNNEEEVREYLLK